MVVLSVLFVSGSAKIASDAMEEGTFRASDSSLAACGVSCQDPWDERGWVSIWTRIVYLVAVGRAELTAMLNQSDGRQARQEMQQAGGKAAGQSIRVW